MRVLNNNFEIQCSPALRKASIDGKEKEQGVEEAIEALQFLENELKSKFFGGETLGLVDIAADFLAFWMPIIEEIVGLQLLTKDRFPKLYGWSQEFVSHPVVKESLPSRDFLFAFLKARFASK